MNGSAYTPNAFPNTVSPNQPAPDTVAQATPAKVTVIVPEGGQVWFDNALTPTEGNHWTYTSAPLEPGRDYTVAIKARWGDGDQAKSYDVPLHVRAGDNMTVDLTQLQ
jgi:uncharacterized protein (TIGR03000 family)